MKNDQKRKEEEVFACFLAPPKSELFPFCSCSQSQLLLDKLGDESAGGQPCSPAYLISATKGIRELCPSSQRNSSVLGE